MDMVLTQLIETKLNTFKWFRD